MVILIIGLGKKHQISGWLQNFKIKICCQGVLVSLASTKHLHYKTIWKDSRGAGQDINYAQEIELASPSSIIACSWKH